ncbi:MAG: hypothetical protein ACOCP8_02610 [archaeon]
MNKDNSQDTEKSNSQDEDKIRLNPEITMMVFKFNFVNMEEIDLEKVAKWSGGHYDKDNFAGLIFYMGDDEEINYENPKKGNKKTLLLYESGKGIITGCKDEEKAQELLNTMKQYLRNVEEVDFKITNMTANVKIDYMINLNEFSKYSSETYRPGTFPCAGFRDEENNTYARVSGKGNISIVGAKSKEDVYQISEKIENILNKHSELVREKDLENN